MIYCGSVQSIVELYQTAFPKDNPLDPYILNEIECEMKLEGYSDTRFVVFAGQCRICGRKEVAIVPVLADLDNLGCVNCGNMTVQEIEDYEEV